MRMNLAGAVISRFVLHYLYITVAACFYFGSNFHFVHTPCLQTLPYCASLSWTEGALTSSKIIAVLHGPPVLH